VRPFPRRPNVTTKTLQEKGLIGKMLQNKGLAGRVGPPTATSASKAVDKGVSSTRIFRTHSFNLGMNRGGLLAWIVCSKPYAIFSRVGSLHARPKNETPTGKPKTNPAGTVTSG
jgi:hypothetical protein